MSALDAAVEAFIAAYFTDLALKSARSRKSVAQSGVVRDCPAPSVVGERGDLSGEAA